MTIFIKHALLAAAACAVAAFTGAGDARAADCPVNQADLKAALVKADEQDSTAQ
jgi:hypothetical protein